MTVYGTPSNTDSGAPARNLRTTSSYAEARRKSRRAPGSALESSRS